MKEKIDNLRNFGFSDEITVDEPGINSKMDEIRAAYGLVNLKQVDRAIDNRKKIAIKYREELQHINGIRFLQNLSGVKHNYSYFPIFIDEKQYGMNRDELFAKLKSQNIFARRYFYPLISDFTPYKNYPSARAENLPVATKLAQQVLCLPMYADLTESEVMHVIEVVRR